ncbi:hypothetical protein AVEN_118532-1 [Araneus ventricosus]|uniref:Uncharacterized protein n=1 Tax=Araneus ventricosus TaxID=182803 RepID=A0A4Y2AVM9_ARAVE|nr:hypothetical protein AVEN_118532-1 [Araneus ventricosus]
MPRTTPELAPFFKLPHHTSGRCSILAYAGDAMEEDSSRFLEDSSMATDVEISSYASDGAPKLLEHSAFNLVKAALMIRQDITNRVVLQIEQSFSVVQAPQCPPNFRFETKLLVEGTCNCPYSSGVSLSGLLPFPQLKEHLSEAMFSQTIKSGQLPRSD